MPAINTYSLSAIQPVTFTYNYNTSEDLEGTYASIGYGWTCFKHDACVDFKDAALSKENCLIITDTKPFKTKQPGQMSTTLSVGSIPSSLELYIDGKPISLYKGLFYVGAPCGIKATPAVFTVVPVGDNTIELRVEKKILEVDSNYPYTARLVVQGMSDDMSYRRFQMEYADGVGSFKIKTPDGYRFLSHGSDRIVRAVGVELNDKIINPYHFVIKFKTRSAINYGSSSTDTNQVVYYNELELQTQSTLNVKYTIDRPTNRLVTCATNELSKHTRTNVNSALLKTNFSTSGKFLPQLP